jgi:hypothetical protein
MKYQIISPILMFSASLSVMIASPGDLNAADNFAFEIIAESSPNIEMVGYDQTGSETFRGIAFVVGISNNGIALYRAFVDGPIVR